MPFKNVMAAQDGGKEVGKAERVQARQMSGKQAEMAHNKVFISKRL